MPELTLQRLRPARSAVVLFATAAISLVGLSVARAASPFDSLAGSWSGSGRVTFEGGQTERLRCNARYRSSGGGNRLGMSIRCASASNSFDLRGDLDYRGGHVSGTWSEQTLGASGSASGRADNNRVVLHFNGTASGNISLHLSHGSHTVTIASQGTALRAINVALQRR